MSRSSQTVRVRATHKDRTCAQAKRFHYIAAAANTAVDNTFVQYYPTLFEVAKRLGTVKPTYDPVHKL